MAALRTRVVKIVLDAVKATKDLKVFGGAFNLVAKSADVAASSVERSAERMGASLARIAAGAGEVRARAQSAGGAGNASSRPRAGSGDSARAAGAANRSESLKAGFAAGAVAVKDAGNALGAFASKSDRAKAAVADLAKQVERNRREMAALREQSIKTGDSDGTLAKRMQGLSAATASAQVELGRARKELRDLDGGIIGAIKSSGALQTRMTALGTAIGNAGYDIARAGLRGVVGGLGTATQKAIDFESAFADVKKVLPDGTTTAQVDALKESVVDLSRKVAIDGPEAAAKLNAALLQTGLYTTDTVVAAAESAAKIGVAFDIGAEEAGQALSKLRTGGNLTQTEVESLSGTINNLSNNMAATAPQILDATTRTVSIGKAANLSAQTMAALSTAMIASGADADVAATGTKNFVRALGAGEAATKKQRAAFAALGVDSMDVAKKLTAGGDSAEKTVKNIVERIGQLKQEERLPVLIQLFGAESISSIGPLATNIDLLTKSFGLAGDTVAAASSIEQEYASRSKTTANAIQLLKNNVSALAIEFGNALLPYINEIVEFLTSPEGQEWGREAVKKTVSAVTTLASALGDIVGVFSSVADSIGGVTTALGAVGIAALALAGPAGPLIAVGLAGAAAGKKIVDSFMSAKIAMSAIQAQANAISKKETDDRRTAFDKEMSEQQKGLDEQTSRTLRASDLADRYREAKLKGKTGDDRSKVIADANRLRLAVEGDNRMLGGGTGDDRLANLQQMVDSAEAGPAGARSSAAGSKVTGEQLVSSLGGDDAASVRFHDLDARRKKLLPDEQAEYTKLSKTLNLRKTTGGAGHKQTKEDKQLAALDPGVRALLTRGGEADAGGDLKHARNALDDAVFKRATGMGGHGSGSGGIGAGPSITNIDNRVMISIAQEIDARGNAPAAENIAAASDRVAQDAGSAVRIVGLERFSARAAGTTGGRR